MKNNNWARQTAVQAVHKILREKGYSNIVLKELLNNSQLSRQDKALVTEIVNGTLKYLLRIDWIFSQFAKISKKKLSPIIEDIIRCGIYQMFFLDRVPDSAICNESSELARKYGHEGAVKFVNGVLRNIGRNKDNINYPDENKNTVQYLSVFYSHPEWMVKKWLQDYGKDFTKQLLEANNNVPPLTIRTNILKTRVDELEQILTNEGISVEKGKYVQEALHIRGTSSLESIDAFKKGYFQVQDESSMLVGEIINPLEGELVLDICSAPGGKTTHIAELMSNEGRVIARDIHKHKLKLVQNSSKRLGINIIETEIFDGNEIDKNLENKCDKVLIDAPCSGLGVIRRKPDLRYNKQNNDFNKLSELQLKMLENASTYVKKSGTLVYSTCTINKTENINVIEKFLEQNKDFEMEDISSLVPSNINSDTLKKGYMELYPNIHNLDGFFIAKLKKR